MHKLFLWMKEHKLSTALLFVLLFFILRGQVVQPMPMRGANSIDSGSMGMSAPMFANRASGEFMDVGTETSLAKSAPTSGARMIAQNSYLSLLVKDVKKSSSLILEKTNELGGYMISSSVSDPDNQGSAQIEIRIPAVVLPQALETFRGIAVKVVSENLQGTDVTDQYTDVEARMETLTKTKIKFEAILDSAVRVTDILEVQRELINLQAEIDSLKGQEKYISESAKLTRVTLYLATDEIALPYMPSETWRPEVVFKEAVRSVISSIRSLANLVIWVLIYGVIWIPAVVIFVLISRRKRKNSVN